MTIRAPPLSSLHHGIGLLFGTWYAMKFHGLVLEYLTMYLTRL